MIDPRIWDSQQVMELTDSQFKLYIYLISQADDDGRVKVSLPLFRARVHPCDNFSEKMVGVDLEQIARSGLVVVYRDDSYAYLWHPNWFRYQRIDRPTPSTIPGIDDSTVEVLADLSSITRRLLVERSSNTKKLSVSKTNDSTTTPGSFDESSTSPRDTLSYTELPNSLSSKKEKITRETIGEDGELYHKVEQAFLSQNGNKFTDYAREGASIKQIIKRAKARDKENAEEVVAAVIDAFWKLKQSRDRFWAGQPFTPSTLNTVSIWDRVLESMRQDELDPAVREIIEGGPA
jgi:hypothetical protein